ncbi:MAG: DUF1934 domain-containing protein [Oscillospiraceae bacterium]|nr:DUF1934 domain-containing protein [Oscillospiraceae bacterium]
MNSNISKNTNALINLKSIQTAEDDKSEVELVTEGVLRPVSGGFEIEYEESETTGYENSTTTIKCLGNSFASLTRKGCASSELVLEVGKKHHCYYETPFGSMMVGIFTNAIENELTEKGGRLLLKYTIDVNSAYVSDNEVLLSVEIR